MHLSCRKTLLIHAISLAMLTISSACFAATPSQEVVNARQETQIWTTYALSPYLRANDLKVAVNDGKATLTGTVEEDVNKELAKAIALGVTGIKEVDNKIEVLADYKPTATGRGYGDHVDDMTIASTVKSKLLWSKYNDSESIIVEAKAGKVTLNGTAGTSEDKELAGRLTKGTYGVKSVDNNIIVNKTPGKTGMAKASTEDASKTIADSWITTKVKSTFIYSDSVDASDIAVSTNAGIVTLSGKLNTGAERALAIELAQNVRGVKSVQSKGLIN